MVRLEELKLQGHGEKVPWIPGAEPTQGLSAFNQGVGKKGLKAVEIAHAVCVRLLGPVGKELLDLGLELRVV